MKELCFSLSPSTTAELRNHPGKKIKSNIGGKNCTIEILIPSYLKQLQAFYKHNVEFDIRSAQQKSGIPYSTHHFGLSIYFEQAQELKLHDEDMKFVDGIKSLIKEYGVVIIKNVFLDSEARDMGHRNRFPNLKFHYDRSELQPTVYSLYTRNPFDDEQKHPRISSTLFIPNLVAYLQSLKEGNDKLSSIQGLCSNYDIFHDENMDDVISNVVAEHRWDEPEGVGELSMIDNRTVLHASYYRDGHHPGYKIGVRYCS